METGVAVLIYRASVSILQLIPTRGVESPEGNRARHTGAALPEREPPPWGLAWRWVPFPTARGSEGRGEMRGPCKPRAEASQPRGIYLHRQGSPGWACSPHCLAKPAEGQVEKHARLNSALGMLCLSSLRKLLPARCGEAVERGRGMLCALQGSLAVFIPDVS